MEPVEKEFYNYLIFYKLIIGLTLLSRLKMMRDASQTYYYALNFSKSTTTAITREENPHRVLPPLQQKMCQMGKSDNKFIYIIVYFYRQS